MKVLSKSAPGPLDSRGGPGSWPAAVDHAAVTAAAPVILYDGVCGLCDRFVGFVLRHDRRRRFRFAPLQGLFAAGILGRRVPSGVATLSTVVLVEHPETVEERVRVRSDAVLAILAELGGAWRWCAALLRVVPRPIRDAAYAVVARVRYRIFGTVESCSVPPVDAGSGRFLD